MPAGYQWSARLNADDELAGELPPPLAAFLLLGAGLLIVAGRRTSYPLFVAEEPTEVEPATGMLRVTARGDIDGVERESAGTLDFDTRTGGTADLRIRGGRPIPVRLHSAFTSVDVGRLRSLTASRPALRMRAAHDDLTLVFASVRERDATFATLAAGAMARVPGRRT